MSTELVLAFKSTFPVPLFAIDLKKKVTVYDRSTLDWVLRWMGTFSGEATPLFLFLPPVSLGVNS